MVHENGSLIYENAEAEESEDMQEEIKGIIHFPCCYKEKKLVFISGRGKVSDKCPRCGKIALFDLDRMNSRCYKPVRGATS
ncbi:MAG: hypothetical protein J6N21_23235 [Butyrivibrio sp.]|nr:hypothetical protein [Butyrivibrio sp.]